MKFQACREDRHGACQAEIELPQLDADNNVLFVDVHACECFCHITVIPDPFPGEQLWNGGE
jgi:hypothetical protein